MIGTLIYFCTGRKLVIYNKHRQTDPIIRDPDNRKAYIFLPDYRIWSNVPFRATSKMKYRVIYLILSILRPSIILDINWINLKGCLYHLWAKKNRPSKFVVVQHGSYVGGIVTDVAHRYTHCDEFLTWGDYFTRYFVALNSKKLVVINSFGNPIYNGVQRNNFSFPEVNKLEKILIVPSAVSDNRKSHYIIMISFLLDLGLQVWFKPHNMQEQIGGCLLLPEEVKLYDGKSILTDFELIVSDISTILLDACFYKRYVLFFMPEHENEWINNSVYAQHMINVSDRLYSIKDKNDLLDMISVRAQEDLFNCLINGNMNNKI